MTERKLTAKEADFIREYLIDRNATQAAIRAGYSENTAKGTACKLLKRPGIAEKIQAAMNDRAKRVELTADMVLKGIMNQVERAKNDDDHRAVLKGLELLGKHLKLFTDVQQVNHTFTQMGRVQIGNSVLEFQVGAPPDKPLLADR